MSGLSLAAPFALSKRTASQTPFGRHQPLWVIQDDVENHTKQNTAYCSGSWKWRLSQGYSSFYQPFCCKPGGAPVNLVTVSTEARGGARLQRPSSRTAVIGAKETFKAWCRHKLDLHRRSWQRHFLTTGADHSGIQSRSVGRHASVLPSLVSKH